MKAKILTPYFDKQLDRLISKDEVIEITENRKNQLSEVGINCEIIKDEIVVKPKQTKKS